MRNYRRQPVRGVVFDLDGVVRYWDPSIISSAEDDWRLPRGALAGAAFSDAGLLARAITGELTDEQWRERIVERLRPQHGDAARGAVEQWSRHVGEVVPAVLSLVRSTRARLPVALLSNATTRLERDLRALSLDEEFDVVLNTARLGVAKPEAAAFESAAAHLGLATAECALVDDTAGHVRAAQDLGMLGHHFTSTEALQEFLAQLRLDTRR